MRYATLLLCFFASSAFAQDYYWIVGGDESGHFRSASAACASAVPRTVEDPPYTNIYTSGGTQSLSDTAHRCLQTLTRKNSNGLPDQVTPPSNWFSLNANRRGDTCPAGGTFDSQKGQCSVSSEDLGKVCESRSDSSTFDKVYDSSGECVLLPNADLSAQCEYLSGKGVRKMRLFVTYDNDDQPTVSPEVNALGCAATAISVAHCKMPVAKSVDGISIQPGGKMCWVDVSFTGKPFEEGATAPMPVANPAAGTQGVCPDPTNCIVPDTPVVTDSKPCNYMYNGQVVGCETTEFQGNPGEMNCGTVNGGAYNCTTRPPTSTGTSVKTEIKTTANPAGGTTVTKDDTHTEVKCTAPGSCTTTVTKTTNVTIKDGAGNTTGSTTNCTGAKCATSTNPDANGDGLGDCVKDCEEEGDGEFKGPEIGETKTVQEATQAFMNAVKGSPLMGAVSSISVPSGGSCHFPSVQTYFAEIDFDTMCDIWADIAPMLAIAMLAAWALLAVRVLMTA